MSESFDVDKLFNYSLIGRMLPVWLLVGPTVIHGILQYLICRAVTTITSEMMKRFHKRDQRKQVCTFHSCKSVI